MRNRYPGTCYRCGERVEPGEGHFERLGNSWRTQHADCAIKFRGQPDAARQAETAKQQVRILELKKLWAGRTGRKAQRARKYLRDLTP